MNNYPDGSKFYLYIYMVGAGVHKRVFDNLSECIATARKVFEEDNIYKVKITDFQGDILLILPILQPGL